MNRKWLLGSAFVSAFFVMILISAGFYVKQWITPTLRHDIANPIYTVGDSNYANAAKQGKKIIKFGPFLFYIYPGGLAFDRIDAATQYLENHGKTKQGWGVYQLSGDFDRDTWTNDGQSYINKSLIVVKKVSSTQVSVD